MTHNFFLPVSDGAGRHGGRRPLRETRRLREAPPGGRETAIPLLEPKAHPVPAAFLVPRPSVFVLVRAGLALLRQRQAWQFGRLRVPVDVASEGERRAEWRQVESESVLVARYVRRRKGRKEGGNEGKKRGRKGNKKRKRREGNNMRTEGGGGRGEIEEKPIIKRGHSSHPSPRCTGQPRRGFPAVCLESEDE